MTTNRPPCRVQRLRTKGWRKPADVINVTRPGKWGNPYVTFDKDHYDLSWCLRAYRRHILAKVEAKELDLDELRGKDLMCWCKLGSPCHADILLEMANTEEAP